jgi:hypothetical protein
MASGDTRCWLSRVTTAPAHTMQGTPSRRAHLCARMTALRPPTALFLSRPPPLAPHAGALSSRSVCTQTRTQLTARTQRRTGVPAFARMATEDAVIVPVQLDVVLVQVGVQVVRTCPHSTHATAHTPFRPRASPNLSCRPHLHHSISHIHHTLLLGAAAAVPLAGAQFWTSADAKNGMSATPLASTPAKSPNPMKQCSLGAAQVTGVATPQARRRSLPRRRRGGVANSQAKNGIAGEEAGKEAGEEELQRAAHAATRPKELAGGRDNLGLWRFLRAGHSCRARGKRALSGWRTHWAHRVLPLETLTCER